MKIYRDIEQGTPEWFALRLGRITASEFHTVLAKGRGSSPSKTRKTYMYKLAGEIITGEMAESFTNQHMERGHVMEVEARNYYSLLTDVEVEQVGFITNHNAGYSPDGLIGNDGLWETKSKLPHLHIAVLLAGKVPPEHVHQCQGGLWVAEREWIDFMSYCPGIKPLIKRMYRDEDMIKKIAEGVKIFRDELMELVEKILTIKD